MSIAFGGGPPYLVRLQALADAKDNAEQALEALSVHRTSSDRRRGFFVPAAVSFG